MAKIPQEEEPGSVRLEKWRTEIDNYFEIMRDFPNMSPQECLVSLAAMTARVSEIRTQIVRLKTVRLEKFRTQEVDFFIAECDRQFKIWSRLITVVKFEHDVHRGI